MTGYSSSSSTIFIKNDDSNPASFVGIPIPNRWEEFISGSNTPIIPS